MTRLELRENDRIGRILALTEDQAVTLSASRLVELRLEPHARWRILPITNMVGALHAGDLDVVVQPKASFASVLFMLGYARHPGFTPQEFDGAADSELWPLVGETLARFATGALLLGVLQGYVTKDESLFVMRGRIRSAEQMTRRLGMALPLEVSYDDYAADIAENRILRTALHRLAFAPRLPDGLRRRLVHLAARLDGVQLIAPGAPLPQWRPNRLNARYLSSLRLSELILNNMGLKTSGTGQSVATFAVNMANVFEDFLTTALRESLARVSLGHTHGQYKAFLDDAHAVTMFPDIVHLIDGVPRAVIDAKYKISDLGAVSDLYQMLSYCTVLGLDQGFLAYAESATADATSVTHHVANTNIRITAWHLDLARSPYDLLNHIDELAKAALREAFHDRYSPAAHTAAPRSG